MVNHGVKCEEVRHGGVHLRGHRFIFSARPTPETRYPVPPRVEREAGRAHVLHGSERVVLRQREGAGISVCSAAIQVHSTVMQRERRFLGLGSWTLVGSSVVPLFGAMLKWCMMRPAGEPTSPKGVS